MCFSSPVWTMPLAWTSCLLEPALAAPDNLIQNLHSQISHQRFFAWDKEMASRTSFLDCLPSPHFPPQTAPVFVALTGQQVVPLSTFWLWKKQDKVYSTTKGVLLDCYKIHFDAVWQNTNFSSLTSPTQWHSCKLWWCRLTLFLKISHWGEACVNRTGGVSRKSDVQNNVWGFLS